MKTPKHSGMNPNLTSYFQESESGFGNIPDERRAQLKKIALYVQSRTGVGQEARLTFICTHNSRRSHLSQLWAQVAAEFYGVDTEKLAHLVARIGPEKRAFQTNK